MWTRKAAELIKLVTYCNNVNALLIMHTPTSTHTKKYKKKLRFDSRSYTDHACSLFANVCL